MEEPEKHIKFILATTETHKVPDTIISRSQRYDFKNISIQDIKNRLIFIAKEENIDIDEDSLNYIAKTSAWWLRDAISLFEQLVVDNKIIYKNITYNLWLVEEELFEIFLDKLLKKDSSIVKDFDDLINSWKNIKLFFKELIFFIKDKMLVLISENKGVSDVLRVLDVLNETYSKTKNSMDENTSFLIGLVKIIDDSK